MFGRLLIFITLLSEWGFAQGFSFYPVQQFPVQYNQNELDLAWVGGLNACQYNVCDLNLDGINDLVVFDRSGFKILPFLFQNEKYVFAPNYAAAFPNIRNWMLMRDFNNDGQMDIFASAGNGISVYKNTSLTNGTLSFELINPLISSNYSGLVDINLFVSITDIPSIEDMDGDGDLDILTFFILGTCVEFHKNMSVENGLAPDALKFKLESDNWGNFTESFTNNSINLNASCGSGLVENRHSGSTLLLLDHNADGIKDLWLGDVSYPDLLMLTNNGQANGQIVAQTNQFPPSNPVNLTTFPAAFKFDVDQDGKLDLLVSPNTEDLAETRASNWFYKDISTTNIPNYVLQTRAFLQNEMIDLGLGAKPVLIDWNNDGLMDLFFSNHQTLENELYISKASICLANQVGSVISYTCSDFGLGFMPNQAQGNLSFTFANLNGDGLVDAVVGDEEGKLFTFFRNQNLAFEYQNSVTNQIDVGFTAHPFLFDLNKDGKQDLIVGSKSGYLSYYENLGSTTNPQFNATATINQLGQVETIDEQMSNFGYSAPCFFVHQNSTWLACGSQSGKIYLYHQIDNNLNGTFQLVDSLSQTKLLGSYSCIAVSDVNNDGHLDLFAGNQSGGLMHWVDDETLTIKNDLSQEFAIFPNPTQHQITIKSPSNWQTYQVFDVSGRMLIQGSNKQESIDLTALDNGVYFVVVTFQNNIQKSKKVIKLD